MHFGPDGKPIFDEHEESVYDYETEQAFDEPNEKRHPGGLLLFGLLGSVVILAAASLSMWIGVDLIGGHDISFREAVGGGWIITAIGGYAGIKAQSS